MEQAMDVPKSRRPDFSMFPDESLRVHKLIPLQQPKKRVPKNNAPPIDVTKLGQFNNGNIEIVETPSFRPLNAQPKVNVDEVLINGRRYRVPERIILLDFWNKISKDVVNGVQ